MPNEKAKPSPDRRETLLTEAASCFTSAIDQLRPLVSEFPTVKRALSTMNDGIIKLANAGVYFAPAPGNVSEESR